MINLLKMTKVTKMLDPRGLSLPWGFIHVYDRYFEMSPPKLLGLSKLNCMWRIHGLVELKFVQVI